MEAREPRLHRQKLMTNGVWQTFNLEPGEKLRQALNRSTIMMSDEMLYYRTRS